MHKPNWMLLTECGHKLAKEGRASFTRRQLIDCVHETYPERKVSSLNPVIQGMTVNSKGGASSGVGKNVFYRAARGVYELYDPHRHGTRYPKVTSPSREYRGSKEYLLVYSELIRAARYRGTTTYQAVAEIMGLPPTGSHMASEVGRILGEINEDEADQGRPMLSALVVGVSGRPGPGFFGMARGLGRLREHSKEAEERFWEEERTAVYGSWKREFKV